MSVKNTLFLTRDLVNTKTSFIAMEPIQIFLVNLYVVNAVFIEIYNGIVIQMQTIMFKRVYFNALKIAASPRSSLNPQSSGHWFE